MEIDLRQCVLGLAVLGLVVLFALIGRGVTPIEAATPVVLTPARWTALNLSRQARGEIGRLEADGQALRALLATEPVDAVQAMLLAQRIYAGYRQGTTATASARQALIAAAAAVARYAGGALTRQEAIEAVNAALQRIQALRGQAVSESHGASGLGIRAHRATDC